MRQFVLQALPQSHGKSAEVGDTGGKRLNLKLRGTKRRRQCLATPGQCRTLLLVGRPVAGRSLGDTVIDKSAAADMADQIALDGQLVECCHHGIARQPQILCQFATGWQALTCAQFAIQHGAA